MKWKTSLRKLAGLPTPFSKKEEKSREIWGGGANQPSDE